MAASRPIGQIFVDFGFVTPEELDEALELQRERDSLIGEILVSQGKMSRLDLASALFDHWYTDDLAVASRVQSRPPEDVEGPGAPVHELEGDVGGPVVATDVGRLHAAVSDLAEALARVEAARLANADAIERRLAAIESAMERPQKD